MKVISIYNQGLFNQSIRQNHYGIIPYQDWTERTEFKIIFGLIMGTLCFITVFGNLCAIYRYRKASFVGNLFIISLACADLIVGCFVMPVASIYAITKTWNLSEPLCQIWLAADYTASTASILNLLTLSLDRYWSITSPLKYLGKRTKSRALIMIAFAWSVSLLWVIPITSWAYLFNNNVRTVPLNKCNTEYNENLTFKVFTAVINFYLPLITMICINIKVYLAIQKRYQSPIMKYTSSNTNIQNPLSKASIKYNAKKQNIYFDNEHMCPISDDSNSGCLNTKLNSIPRSTMNTPNTLNTIFYVSSHSTLASQNTNIVKSYQTIVSSKTKTPVKCNLFRLRSEEQKLLANVKLSNSINSDLGYSTSEASQNGSYLNVKTRMNDEMNDRKKSENTKSSFLFNLHKCSSNKKERVHLNRQEKAFKQLIAIVAGFTICFMPYFVIYLLVAICQDCVSESAFTLSIWLGYLNSTINPFLYALSSKQSTRSAAKRKALNELNNPCISHANMNTEQCYAMYIRRGVLQRYSGTSYTNSMNMK